MRLVRSKDHFGARGIGFATGRPEQVRNPPRDRRRRIDPVDRPRCKADKAIEQQWIMRAGEHDRVGARCLVLAAADKTGRELGKNIVIADVVAAQSAFGERGQLRRTHQRHLATSCEIADQPPRIFALDRAPRAEHRNPARPRLRAGRLYRRNRAHKGNFIGLSQIRHHERGGGVAGDHDQIGRVAVDQVTDQRHHARDDFILAVMAVRKEGIVGDIDVMGVGPCGDDFAQHGEAAEAGIEYQDGRGNGHAAILAHDPEKCVAVFRKACLRARPEGSGANRNPTEVIIQLFSSHAKLSGFVKREWDLERFKSPLTALTAIRTWPLPEYAENQGNWREMLRNTSTNWGSLSRWFHWILGITIIGMVAYGWWMNHFPARADRFFYRSIHADIGYVVLLITVIRLIW